MNKKGMETWQLMLIVIGIVLLVVVVLWYFQLRADLAGGLNNFKDALG